MSQERVERLEALLSRVQNNRKRTRTPAGLGNLAGNAARPEIAKAMAAPAPAREAPKPAPMVAEVAKPAAPARPAPAATAVRTVPPAPPPSAAKAQPVARPAPIAEAAITRPAAIAEAPVPRAEVQPPRPAEPLPARRGQDRSATPLEMAVAELDLASAAAQAKAEAARREPVAAAPPPTPAPMAPSIAPEEAFEPRVIEPEPIREAARPIAQVVSRHAPQVDATFGAMLKRSLSLRPH